MTDDLAALRLLLEWGADEALADAPLDRFASVLQTTRPGPAPGREALIPAPSRAAATPVPVMSRSGGAVAEARFLAAAAGTLPALQAALDAFTGCPLRATATTTVRPSGNSAAGLVLVAEAPGAEDDRSGDAFSGPSGHLMDRVLGSIGLDRSSVLLAHLVPWRPPGNRAPSDSEVQACLPFLHRLLALAQPRRLVLLGAGPAKALAGTSEGVRRLRGRWLPVAIEGCDAPVQAMPLPALEQWMRSAATKRNLWTDLLELQQSIEGAT